MAGPPNSDSNSRNPETITSEPSSKAARRLASLEDLPTEVVFLIAGHLSTLEIVALAAAAVHYSHVNEVLVQRWMEREAIDPSSPSLTIDRLPQYAITALKHYRGAKNLQSLVIRFSRDTGHFLVANSPDVCALVSQAGRLRDMKIILDYSDDVFGRGMATAGYARWDLESWKDAIFSVLQAIPESSQCRVVIQGAPLDWSTPRRKLYGCEYVHPVALDGLPQTVLTARAQSHITPIICGDLVPKSPPWITSSPTDAPFLYWHQNVFDPLSSPLRARGLQTHDRHRNNGCKHPHISRNRRQRLPSVQLC